MTTDALSHQVIQGSMNRAQPEQMHQYTVWKILGIWALVTVPMALLGWVVYPALSVGASPLNAGLLRMKFLTIGLIWEFVLAMIILYHEEGNIRLSTICRRFWLNHPVSVKTGETKKSLWLWIIPAFLLLTFFEVAFRPALTNLWTGHFPFFAEPVGYGMSVLLTPELRVQMVGSWGFFGLFFVMSLFNTFLGEEFLFRGMLLPKMEGVFGKWDWMVNGVMFGFYHLHQPWGILSDILAGLVFAFTGKRFRSSWFPIILHSLPNLLLLLLILGLVIGLT